MSYPDKTNSRKSKAHHSNSTNCTNVSESRKDELVDKTLVASPGGKANTYSETQASFHPTERYYFFFGLGNFFMSM